MADCCSRLKTGVEAKDDTIAQEVAAQWSYWHGRLTRILQRPAGNFVVLPNGAEVPSLRELMQRVETPLNAGFSEWEWYNQTQAGKTTLTLPQAPTRYRVSLNGADLHEPRDYSLAGATLTFTHPLDIADIVRVHSYGS